MNKTNAVRFSHGVRFIISAHPHEADIEFYGTVGGFQSDAFVVSVDGSPLFGGQIHGGEAVDAIRNSAVMSGIRALYHEVGRHDTAFPRRGDC